MSSNQGTQIEKREWEVLILGVSYGTDVSEMHIEKWHTTCIESISWHSCFLLGALRCVAIIFLFFFSFISYHLLFFIFSPRFYHLFSLPLLNLRLLFLLTSSFLYPFVIIKHDHINTSITITKTKRVSKNRIEADEGEKREKKEQNKRHKTRNNINLPYP